VNVLAVDDQAGAPITVVVESWQVAWCAGCGGRASVNDLADDRTRRSPVLCSGGPAGVAQVPLLTPSPIRFTVFFFFIEGVAAVGAPDSLDVLGHLRVQAPQSYRFRRKPITPSGSPARR
jgi:hypothetical protein